MILVTVGTTPFDDLIRAVDEKYEGTMNLVFQIADGDYKPRRFEWVEYSDDIESLYREAQFAVCHAGAGTVFRLLELNKKIIVVPNLVRSDSHQKELSEFLDQNQFAIVCQTPQEVVDRLAEISSVNLRPFVKQPFLGAQLLLNIIDDEYKVRNAD